MSCFSVGIANCKWYGIYNGRHYLALDLMGNSLQEYSLHRFTLKTVLLLAVKLIKLFRYLHSNHFIHGSVKPANFMMGGAQTSQRNCCYMIDFGRSRRFRNPRTGKHIEDRVDDKYRYYRGPFFSVNAGRGLAYSRRDDMQSLGYMLMYFIRGGLPWDVNHIKGFDVKASTSAESLCEGYPSEFLDYFIHVESLGFDERPDYASLRTAFTTLFHRLGFKGESLFGK